MNEPGELERLIDAYLDGNISEAEMKELDRRIADDPKVAAQLAKALQFHADMRDYLREASDELWDTTIISVEAIKKAQSSKQELSPVTSHRKLAAIRKSRRATRRLYTEQNYWIPALSSAAILLIAIFVWSATKSTRPTPNKNVAVTPTQVLPETPKPAPIIEKPKPSTEVAIAPKTPEVEAVPAPRNDEPDIMEEVRKESLARIEAERRKAAELVASQQPLAPDAPVAPNVPAPQNTVQPVEPRSIAEVLTVNVPAGSGTNVPVVVRGWYEQATRTPLKVGTKLSTEDVIESGLGQVTLAYLGENTRIELKKKSILRLFEKNGDEKSKRLSLEHGELTAQVDKQLPGRPMLLLTPHAEATVLGTQFSLTVNRDNTTLNVTEGKVRFTRAVDKSFVDVARGESATAGAANAQQGLAIFNGKDLNDWIVTRGKWAVEDGLVVGQDLDGGASRIESKASYKNFELTAKVRVTNSKLAEFQVRTYAYFFQLQWDQPGQWTDVKMTVRGDEMSATQDGKAIHREEGDGDTKKQSGPIGFFVSRGGRMELKDVKLRELP